MGTPKSPKVSPCLGFARFFELDAGLLAGGVFSAFVEGIAVVMKILLSYGAKWQWQPKKQPPGACLGNQH